MKIRAPKLSSDPLNCITELQMILTCATSLATCTRFSTSLGNPNFVLSHRVSSLISSYTDRINRFHSTRDKPPLVNAASTYGDNSRFKSSGFHNSFEDSLA